MLNGMKGAREALAEYYREDAPVMVLLDDAIVEAEGSKHAYEMLLKENAKLRDLIELIFASTCPYNDGEATFIDKVTDAWKELAPNAKVSGAGTASAGLPG